MVKCYFPGHAPFTAVVNNRHRNLTIVWRQWKEGDIKVKQICMTIGSPEKCATVSRYNNNNCIHYI